MSVRSWAARSIPSEATERLALRLVKAIAVTSQDRASVTPTVPTVAESGLPGFDVTPCWGLLGPAGMSPGLVRRINADVNDLLREPTLRDFMARIGAEPYAIDPDTFRTLLKANVERWGTIVASTNARAAP